MDIMERYRTGLEHFKLLKAFIQELDPIDYELTSFLHSLDSKINKAEDTLNSLSGNKNVHRCGICERKYDEVDFVSVDLTKVCPVCREQGMKWKLGSDWEEIYDLSPGTIKRDCIGKENEQPKLQPYMDAGLINKSGIHNMVHEKVMLMYYMNPDKYKRRKTKKTQ
jgi:hypothetical protein